MSETQISYRYSKVLFELSLQANKLDEIYGFLQEIGRLLLSNQEFKILIRNPLLLQEDRSRILNVLFEKKLPGLLMNFLLFLNFKERLSFLEEIINNFYEMYLEKNNQMNASLETAFDLQASQKQAIQEKLGTKYQKTIFLNSKTEKDLLGGFRLFVAGLLIDGSIKSQLEQFRLKVSHN